MSQFADDFSRGQKMSDVEEIPDKDEVFYRIHKNFFIGGRLQPGVFREIGDDMSVDWEKYSTPVESVCRAKVPVDNGIVSLIAGDVRNIKLEVIHKPSENNMAHSIVRGIEVKIKDTEIRFKLKKLAKWEIQVGDYQEC